jgi:Transposase, Mutator family
MLSVVADEQARTEFVLDLDELVREGARRMLAAALEAEVDAYLAAHAELVDADGHRLVVRNGHAPARQLATAAGQVEVVRPRVDDRRTDPATGQRVQFHSVILPRWCRRSPKVAEVLPLLYLHGRQCGLSFPTAAASPVCGQGTLDFNPSTVAAAQVVGRPDNGIGGYSQKPQWHPLPGVVAA